MIKIMFIINDVTILWNTWGLQQLSDDDRINLNKMVKLSIYGIISIP